MRIKRLGAIALSLFTFLTCLAIPKINVKAETVAINITKTYAGSYINGFSLREGLFESYGSWGIEEPMFCSQFFAGEPGNTFSSYDVSNAGAQRVDAIVYESPILVDNANLRKALYYGYGGPANCLAGKGYTKWQQIGLTNELCSIARAGREQKTDLSGSGIWYEGFRLGKGEAQYAWNHTIGPLWDEIRNKPDPRDTVNYNAYMIKTNTRGVSGYVDANGSKTRKAQDLVFGYCNPATHEVKESGSRKVAIPFVDLTNSTPKKTDQDGRPLAGSQVRVELSEDGGKTWSKIGTMTSNSNGIFVADSPITIAKTFTTGEYKAQYITNYNKIRNNEKPNFTGWSQNETDCRNNLKRDFVTPDLDRQEQAWRSIKRKIRYIETKAPSGHKLNSTPVEGGTIVNERLYASTRQKHTVDLNSFIEVDMEKIDEETKDKLNGGLFEVWVNITGKDANLTKVGELRAENGKLKGRFEFSQKGVTYTGKEVNYAKNYDSDTPENKAWYDANNIRRTKAIADDESKQDAIRQATEGQKAFDTVSREVEIREVKAPTSYTKKGDGVTKLSIGANHTVTGTILNEGSETLVGLKVDGQGQGVKGAKMKLTRKSDGHVFDEWVSNGEPHIVNRLTAETVYTITETQVPEGYITPVTRSYDITTGKVGEDNRFNFVNHKITISKKDVAGEELPGASMKVLDKDGNVVDEWTSGVQPHQVKNLVEGKTYILHEDLAPLGYNLASDIEFTATDEDQHIDMVDSVTTFSKVDVGGEEVEGAKIQVMDEDGNVVDEWISEKKPHAIQNLETGKTYRFHEEVAPNGYVYANDFEFTVDGTDNKHYTMVDTIQVVEKLDEEGNPVVGAKLQLVNKETGEVVDEWTTGETLINLTKLQQVQLGLGQEVVIDKEDANYTIKPAGEGRYRLIKVTKEETPVKTEHFINVDGVEVGHLVSNAIALNEYILKEVETPKGFVKATDMEVTPSDKEDQTLQMVDKKVKFTKEDVTGEEVEGAKIEVVDEDGNVVDEWVSGKEPHYIENLEEGKKYTLKETITPGGYIQASAIDFEVTPEGLNAHYKMVDTIHRVIKIDEKKNTVKNARLAVYTKDGKKVDEWVTGNHIVDLKPENIVEAKLTGESYIKGGEPLAKYKEEDLKAIKEDLDKAVVLAYPDIDFVPEQEKEEIESPEVITQTENLPEQDETTAVDTETQVPEEVVLTKEEYLQKAFEKLNMTTEELEETIAKATELLDSQAGTTDMNKAEDIRKELYALAEESFATANEAIEAQNANLTSAKVIPNEHSSGGYTFIQMKKDGTMTYTDIDQYGDEANHRVSGLVAGEEYILKELKAPFGYMIAPEMVFQADESTDLKFTVIDRLVLEQSTGIETLNPLYIVGGVAILAIAGVTFLVIKKRKSSK